MANRLSFITLSEETAARLFPGYGYEVEIDAVFEVDRFGSVDTLELAMSTSGHPEGMIDAIWSDDQAVREIIGKIEKRAVNDALQHAANIGVE